MKKFTKLFQVDYLLGGSTVFMDFLVLDFWCSTACFHFTREALPLFTLWGINKYH